MTGLMNEEKKGQSLRIANKRLKRLLSTSALVAAGVLAFAGTARAVDNLEVPVDGKITGGAGTIDNSQAAAGILDINQFSGRMTIDWKSFNIGKDAVTTFHQPGSDSIAVNRVTFNDGDPSRILGTLRANGNVYVLDANGVFFGRDATIDVGGIVASTGELMNQADFLSGANPVFGNLGDGAIINEATINVADAGLAAFVAPTVINNGVINARLGRVAMAAGETVTLDLYGDGLMEVAVDGELADALLENNGVINAEGGVVSMTAAAAKDVVDSVINMDGVINVSSVEVKGGKIILSGGDKGTVSVTGTMDASGTEGGSIDVTGERVDLAETSTLDVSGATEAGRIYAYGDNLFSYGNLFAHGRNGFIETSMIGAGVIDGNVEMGEGGEYLIDPNNVCIASGLGSCSLVGATLVTTNFVETTLSNPSLFALSIWTHGSDAEDGDIEIAEAINAATTNTNLPTFYLNAYDDIFVNADVTDSGNGFDFVLNADFDGSGNGGVGGDAEIFINANIDTNGGDFTANAPGSFNLAFGNGIDAGVATLNTPTVNLAGTIDALTLTGTATVANISDGGRIQNGVDVVVDGSTMNVGAGTYNESVTVDVTGLTINGANAGLVGNDAGRGAESVVNSFVAPAFAVTADDVTIDGFTIEGVASPYSVLVADADRAVITNNVIAGKGTSNGVFLLNSNGSVVSRNYIHDIAGTAVDVSGSAFGTSVSDNFINNVEGNGIHLFEIAGNVNVFSNEIQNVAHYGVWSESPEVFSSVNVNDNAVNGTGEGGIRVDGNALEVVGNSVNNTAGDAIEVSNSMGVSIHNNLIGFFGGPGSIGGEGIDVNNSPVASIVSNTVMNTVSNGISVNPSPYSVIFNNTLDYIAGHGILVDGSDNVMVMANNIGQLSGGLFASGDAIHITNGANSAVVEANLISTAGRGVAVVGGDDHWIDGNTIVGATQGVSVSGGNGVQIQNNAISQTSGTAIDVLNNGDVLVASNIIRDAGGNGVSVQFNEGRGGFVRIAMNDIAGVANDGIFAAEIDTMQVDGNTVTDAGANGIGILRFLNAEVLDNTVSDVGGNGIFADGYNDDGLGYAIMVADNTVSDADGNGIQVGYTDDTSILRNTVRRVGVDGVNVYNASEAIVDDNDVRETGDDGIEVSNSGYTKIRNNTLQNIGYYLPVGDLPFKGEGPGYNEADGISVMNVAGINVGSGDYVELPGSNVVIENNLIRKTGDDGIEVSNSGSTWIAGNTIYDAGYYGMPDLNGYGADGIRVLAGLDSFYGGEFYLAKPIYVPGISYTTVQIVDNTVDTSADDGIQVVGATDVLVDGNYVVDSGDDGINILGFAGYYDEATNSDIQYAKVALTDAYPVWPTFYAEVTNNVVEASGTTEAPAVLSDLKYPLQSLASGGDGIQVEGFDSALIAGNEVTDSAQNGLYVSGFNNGYVGVFGNTFTRNDIGAQFESGLIILTEEGNEFVGGRVGMRFAPYDFASVYGGEGYYYGNTEWGIYADMYSYPFSVPYAGYAPLALVDNDGVGGFGGTIGAQSFNGQSEYFVELANEAFFAPGEPTILDGLESTYVTPFGAVLPATTGLSIQQANYLEDMFYHYVDQNDLGLFFFGATAQNANIDLEDIFKEFDPFLSGSGGVNVQIQGMPTLPNPLALRLAGIAPAAGDEEGQDNGQGNGSPAANEDVADIEPAAGGQGQDVACWGDAIADASAGVTTTYSFGFGADEILSDASGCQTEF